VDGVRSAEGSLRSQNPAFLVCSERSGSNLLRVMLDSHPGIVAPPALHLGRDIGRNLYAFGQGLDDDARWTRVADAVARRIAKPLGEERARTVRDSICELTERNYAGLVEAVYRPLLDDHVREFGGDPPLLFLKENHTHKQAFFLLHHFPEAKFVFQVRDPRDYLASLRARRKGLLGNKYGSTRHALEVWRDDQLGGLNLLAHLGPERVFLQRYEDLIADPEKVLSSLCEFLGLAFDPAMLAFHERGEVQSVARESGPWENLAKPVMSGNAKKYRDQLGKRHIRTVEHYIGHLMEVFGYELDFRRAGGGALLRTLWPQITEPWERLANEDRSPMYPEGGRFFAKLEGDAAPASFPYASERRRVDGAAARPSAPPPAGPWRLVSGFVRSTDRDAGAPALTVEGRTYAYGELRSEAERVAAEIAARETADTVPCTAILAERSFVTYAAILGALLRGHAYVPLNPRFPAARNRAMLRRSGASVLVVERRASGQLPELLADEEVAAQLSLVLAPDTPTAGEFAAPPQNLVTVAEMSVTSTVRARVHDNGVAYILFTSGSTGQPKGVPVTHENLEPFVEFARTHLDVQPTDRFSQTFDITFDLSVFDLFVAWSSGAHVVVPSRLDLLSPARYLFDQKLTVWFAVPSLGQQMHRQGSLAAGAFPDLRVSLFCGEALPADLADAWSGAAPNGILENWYGPTEATISCTRYRWTDADAGREFAHGLVPIGEPFPRLRARVLDAELRPVADGQPGELLVAGAQVTGGYLHDAERTGRSFCVPPGESETHYRTGDRALVDGRGQLQFLGRVDNQTKIQGYRVELGEIEAALRAACAGRAALALPWPAEMNADYVVAAVEGGHLDEPAVQEELRRVLAPYMVPRRVVALSAFPTNASGKADRKAVRALVEERLSGAAAGKAVPDTIEGVLIHAVQEECPGATKDQVLASENLIDAGLSSLGFVSLTQRLEQLLGVEFTQHDVAFLAAMPVAEFVDAVHRAFPRVPVGVRCARCAAGRIVGRSPGRVHGGVRRGCLEPSRRGAVGQCGAAAPRRRGPGAGLRVRARLLRPDRASPSRECHRAGSHPGEHGSAARGARDRCRGVAGRPQVEPEGAAAPGVRVVARDRRHGAVRRRAAGCPARSQLAALAQRRDRAGVSGADRVRSGCGSGVGARCAGAHGGVRHVRRVRQSGEHRLPGPQSAALRAESLPRAAGRGTRGVGRQAARSRVVRPCARGLPGHEPRQSVARGPRVHPAAREPSLGFRPFRGLPPRDASALVACVHAVAAEGSGPVTRCTWCRQTPPLSDRAPKGDGACPSHTYSRRWRPSWRHFATASQRRATTTSSTSCAGGCCARAVTR